MRDESLTAAGIILELARLVIQSQGSTPFGPLVLVMNGGEETLSQVATQRIALLLWKSVVEDVASSTATKQQKSIIPAPCCGHRRPTASWITTHGRSNLERSLTWNPAGPLDWMSCSSPPVTGLLRWSRTRRFLPPIKPLTSFPHAQAYGRSAPFPRGNVMAQDIFLTGVVPADTDFRMFSAQHYGRLPGEALAPERAHRCEARYSHDH